MFLNLLNKHAFSKYYFLLTDDQINFKLRNEVTKYLPTMLKECIWFNE